MSLIRIATSYSLQSVNSGNTITKSWTIITANVLDYGYITIYAAICSTPSVITKAITNIYWKQYIPSMQPVVIHSIYRLSDQTHN